MVTRLRAILSTLRPSCLHNQPYRWGTRCGPVAWSRGAAVRLTESKLALAARSDPPCLCSSVLCCRHRDAAPPPLLFLAGASVGELHARSEICSLSSRRSDGFQVISLGSIGFGLKLFGGWFESEANRFTFSSFHEVPRCV